MTENELGDYIRCFRGTVFRLAYSYLKNREDAEDVAQEAFLKLYRSEERFEAAGNVKAWLIRVTINISKNLLNNSWHKKRTEIDGDIPCESRKESILVEYIGRLKPEYGMVVHLFYYEGYSVKEISQICRISSSAVRTRLTRAGNQLKKMLLKEGFHETGL